MPPPLPGCHETREANRVKSSSSSRLQVQVLFFPPCRILRKTRKLNERLILHAPGKQASKAKSLFIPAPWRCFRRFANLATRITRPEYVIDSQKSKRRALQVHPPHGSTISRPSRLSSHMPTSQSMKTDTSSIVIKSQVKSIHKQQTTIRKPIECAPEASSGGREWAEMTEGFHIEATRH